MVHDRSPDVATATFDGTAESVGAARRFVRDVLADVDDDVATDAALLTSELATNAVIHAQTPFEVTIRHDAAVVRVEVQDGSTVSARRCRYSATSGTGRGLGMVEDLSDGWGVEDVLDGKRVWFSLATGRRAGRGDEVTSLPPGADGAPDLDAILADFGGWDDDASNEDAALRWAA